MSGFLMMCSSSKTESMSAVAENKAKLMASKKRKTTDKVKKDEKSEAKGKESPKIADPPKAADPPIVDDEDKISRLESRLEAAKKIIDMLRSRAADRHDEYDETGYAIRNYVGCCDECYADDEECECECSMKGCENKVSNRCNECYEIICDGCNVGGENGIICKHCNGEESD
jgi:hypothetical protein